MLELCNFFLSEFIPSMFNATAIYYAFCALVVYCVFALLFIIIRGKGVSVR